MSFGRVKLAATTTAAAAALFVSMCSSATEPLTLNMATPWSGGHWLEQGAKGYASMVEELTEGRIKINVFAGGTLGEPLKVTELVHRGVADVGHNWPSYDWGVDKTGILFGGWAGGFSGEETLLWLYNGGGAELWQQWRLEQSDVVAVPCGSLESEVFLHTHKPVRTLDDYKGMKVRTSGAWAEIAPKIGASTVIMPGAEVFTALERGVVDGIEWGGPGINLPAGFHDIAKYIVLPGVHAPGGAHECIFNKDVWAKIDKRDRELLKVAGKLTMMNTWLAYANDDLEAFQQYQQSDKNEIVQLDPAFVQAAKQASDEWAQKLAGENEWFRKVYENQQAFAEKLKNWPKFRPEIGVR